MPPLAGASLAQAKSAIAGANLSVGQVRTQTSDTVAKGVVISSSPAAGAKVAPNAAVGLVVSSGPAPAAEPVVELVAVPGVAGSSLSSARTMITDAKLAVGPVKTQASDSVAKGVVISSSPGPGARVKEGARVGLVVSSGPAEVAKPAAPAVPDTPAVPEVVGLPVAQATAALREAGLRVVVVDADGNPATAGTVVAASPPKNKRVTLTVQAAPSA